VPLCICFMRKLQISKNSRCTSDTGASWAELLQNPLKCLNLLSGEQVTTRVQAFISP
jgi:hypothetical protein